MKIKKLIYLLTFVIAVFSCTHRSNEVPDEPKVNTFDSINQNLLDTLKYLSNFGYFDIELGRYCDDVLSDSCTFYTFITVLDSGSRKAFTILLDHPNPIIRMYAFAALSDYDVDYFPFLKKALNDSTMLPYKTSEGIFIERLGRLALRFCMEDFLVPEHQMDSLRYLLLSVYPEYINELNVLNMASFDSCHYETIRTQAKKSDKALVALSRYQNTQDIEIITNRIENAGMDFNPVLFSAGAVFQDSAIYKSLVSFSESYLQETTDIGSELQYFYMALASYKTKESLSVLEKCLDHKNYQTPAYIKLNKYLVYKAITKHYSPFYQNLKGQLAKDLNYYQRRYVYAETEYY